MSATSITDYASANFTLDEWNRRAGIRHKIAQEFKLSPNDVRNTLHGAPFDDEMRRAGNSKPFLVLTGTYSTGRQRIGPVGYRRTRPDYDMLVPVFIDNKYKQDIPLSAALSLERPMKWKIENIQANPNFNFRANANARARANATV